MNDRSAVLQFMWPFVRPYWRRIAVAMLGLAVAAAAVLAIGEGLKRVIDQGFAAGSSAEIDKILVVMVALALAQGIGIYVRFSNIAWVNNRVVNDIRQRIYAHLLTLSPAFFERERVGDVLSRLTNDTQVLEGVVSNAFSWALRNLVMMLGALIMLALTSPKLLVYVLVGTPLVIAPVVLLGRRVRNLAKQSQDRLADAMARGDETIHAVRTVQAYAREGFERQRFSERINAVFSNAAARERTSAMLSAIVVVLAFTGVSVILWIGGHDVLAGRMTAGQLSAFIFYAVMVATAVGAISEVFGQLKRAAGASERIRELLATPTEIAAPATPLALPAPRGEVTFDNVTFSYPTRPQAEALKDFSLAVKPGEVVALVGPSGAGKSTVFQLLLRFYDPKAGVVSVDGVDVKAADLNALRERFALVSQEPVIFAGSVTDNVRYGNPDASDADVRAACDAAHVTEFASALPNGFDTELGERGVRLSGGQRQRVAIARAILANRPILLLDEATSALDAESEALVTDAIEKLARPSGGDRVRTTLIIAHRLSTVQNADRIVVIDEGRVMAQGTHAELMNNSPLYSRLASLQLQG
ncbi:MAG TPA: ABC transporter transmembrane domain-containing protein [Casimicrobium huifangae]|nr:ABC transporter transmembrane domain-containing protein [Casimicrobium huifangae]HQA33607.1 ABC transporter transmembrane domain-containing protein [Casimicrobium huifangae]HQD64262.1 ABC transporter transmembrane domain-containing protein [Casimicrobium huifangae]